MGRRKTVGVDLPPYVRRKNGLYYFNAGGADRDIPMGPKFDPAVYARLMRDRRDRKPEQAPLQLFKQLARAAKTRAADRGLECELCAEYLQELFERGRGRCAISGIPFDLTTERETRVRPYGVSVDRIDPRGPYTKGNVRLILTALNIAINEFGWEVYRRIARRAVRNYGHRPFHAEKDVTTEGAVTS